MKIYIVSDGDYSDYHIIGIYSTREKAEYAKNLYLAKNKIRETTLDYLPEHPNGCLPWFVRMDSEGNVKNSGREDPNIISGCKWGAYYLKDKGGAKELEFFFKMWATDEEHAIKIASEYRRRLLAEAALINLDWKNERAINDFWKTFYNLKYK